MLMGTIYRVFNLIMTFRPHLIKISVEKKEVENNEAKKKKTCKSANIPFSASISVLAGPPTVDSVKNVPTLRPAIIVLIALSCVPLQITTLTPRSS